MPLRRAHLLRADSCAQLQRPAARLDTGTSLSDAPSRKSQFLWPPAADRARVNAADATHHPLRSIHQCLQIRHTPNSSLRSSAAECVSTPPMTTHHPLRFTHQNPQITHTGNKTVWSLLAPAAERACTDAADDHTLPNQVHSQKSANHGEVFPWSLHHNDRLATGEQFKISKTLLQGVKDRGMTV
ncbi:hypothetical protein B0H14DRAFT_3453811 [Mycena olivaceomarginata]|nr:hypothetical protein B0H14DRAFT_3453811 [Mycena olivaceomarginata]